MKDDYEKIRDALLRGSNNYIKNVCRKRDVDACRADGTPILAWAVQQNKLMGVKILLQKGADINKKDADGRTPLMHAVTLSGFAMTAVLCEKKYGSIININAKDDDGWTAMNFALVNGNVQAIAILEHNGGKKGGL